MTKNKKREQKLKKAKKALATKKNIGNRVARTQEPELYELPNKPNDNKLIAELFSEHKKPNYQDVISSFEGTMKEWYDLVLKLHNEFGYGFEYEDLEDNLLSLILDKLPEAKDIIEAQYDSSDEMVATINNNFNHKLIDMLVVTSNQNGDYWSGDLERNDLLTYGLVDAD